MRLASEKLVLLGMGKAPGRSDRLIIYELEIRYMNIIYHS